MREARAEIYTITHIASGKHYVGSSIDARRRFVQHKNALNKGTHTSKRLQNSWMKYGADAFTFRIIEICREVDRAAREQFHIDDQKPFFNWARTLPASLDPRVRKQISKAMRDNQNTKGLKWSDEGRANLSKARTGMPQSPVQRAATLRALELARQNNPANQSGWIPKHRIGMKDSKATIEKRRATRLAFEAARRQAGIENYWITNGMSEYMIPSTDAIPEGWRHGRQPKIGAIGRSRVGEKRSPEARSNMSKAHLGVKLSAAHRVAQSQGRQAKRFQGLMMQGEPHADAVAEAGRV